MRRCEGEEEAHEALGLQLGADTYFAAGESGRAALLSCGSKARDRRLSLNTQKKAKVSRSTKETEAPARGHPRCRLPLHR